MTSLLNLSAGGELPFYPETIDQSLRFEEGDTSYLERTFVTPSSTRKLIIATWIKPSELGDETPIMYSAPTSATTSYFLMGFAQDGFISADDSFKIFTVEGNTQRIALRTTALFRDPTAWMHVCVAIDTTQATDTDRVVIFFNGKRYTGTYNTYNTFPSQNHDFTVMNSAIKHRIGSSSNGLHANYGNLSGYLSEFYFVDGQSIFSDTSGTINSTFLADANTLTTFCEQKNGVAVPKTYSGTFGNNGCRLTFEGTGTGTTAQGTTAQTNIGDDQSGEGHNFSVNGLASTDVYTDSPTNNLATLNPLWEKSVATLSEGNLKMSGSAGGIEISTIAFRGSQKFYYEVKIDSIGSWMVIGILETDGNTSNLSPNQLTDSRLTTYGQNGAYYTAGSYTSSGGFSYTTNDIVGILFDNGTMTAYKNGVAQTPVQSSISTSKLIFAYVAMDNVSQGMTLRFAEQDWTQAPTGVDSTYELSSTNLDDTTLSPNQTEQADDYFNTVLYTGNGSSGHAITGVGFQPDWVWIKGRSGATNHGLHDSSRVISGNEAILNSNTTSAESTGGAYLSSFDSDGFTVNNNTSGNNSSDTYVAWNWKANGGTTSSNTDGTITSTVQASTDAGFSIATYTGTGSAGTIGHGLGKKPSMYWTKNRDDGTQSWLVYHEKVASDPETDYLILNRTDATADDSSVWNDTAPTTSVFSVGSATSSNGSSDNMLAYVFAEIEGYSKFGSYTGNGSTDGTFIFTGFRPAWVMTKRTNSTGNWYMNDSARSPANPTSSFGANLYADLSNAESGNGMDMLSSGFKIRNTDTSQNASGSTYIYMAFAEQPFKFSNAR
jgi:hypothetical protein